MYSCFQVACSILQSAKNQDIGVNSIKLVKLVYLCHGFYLALHGKGLVKENIEAWPYGVNIDRLYKALPKDVEQELTIFDIYQNIDKGTSVFVNPVGDLDFINDVVKKYAALHGRALSSLTSHQIEAWKIAREISNNENVAIPDSLIRMSFENYINERMKQVA